MTANRDFKHLVRARMSKTGESYTTARSHVLRNAQPRSRAAAQTKPVIVEPAKPDYDALAGMSSAAVKAKTGCGWDKWVYVLDKAKADTWPHAKIADYIHEKYKVPGWWTQTVTVGYERIKGLRAIGQRLSGAYEATRSRTFPVPMAELFAAWNSKKARSAWMGDVPFTVRKATKNKSMRISWDDGTDVVLWFQAPAKNKSQVAVTHAKLASKADADARKAFWGEKLDALGAFLGPKS